MNLTLSFGTGAPISTSAHFRGVSSFRDCASRKSLTVNLVGSHARRLQPGSATDRLFLISMCADDRYVKTQLANTLASMAGVYRVPQRYVRLLIAHTNGTSENLGVYLLLEDPDYTFAKDASALVSIVRRRSDPERAEFPIRGAPYVKLPKDSADAPAQHTPAAAAGLRGDRQLGARPRHLVGDVEVCVADELAVRPGEHVPYVDVAAVAQVEHHVLGQGADAV